ncbi:MAG: glycosyl hydrolase family 28-related protein [Gammaproteobacteria bacterium]
MVVDVTKNPINAKGDSSHDNTAAIETAIDMLRRNGGGTLYFPRGRYLTTQRHRISRVPCRIMGDGPGLSAVEWDTEDGGFHFVGGGFSGNNVNSLYVSNLALVTHKKLGGVALEMEWDVGNLSAVQHFAIENTQIKGSTLYVDSNNVTAWEQGILSIGAYNSTINNVQILGSSGLSSVEANGTRGITLQSVPGHQTRATGIHVSNF